METELLLKLQLKVQEAGTITGFNYAFCKLLVERLKYIANDEGLTLADPEYGGRQVKITGETFVIITHLNNQLGDLPFYVSGHTDIIDTYNFSLVIRTIEAFLAIFEPTEDWD